jgi:hypothetical protein
MWNIRIQMPLLLKAEKRRVQAFRNTLINRNINGDN